MLRAGVSLALSRCTGKNFRALNHAVSNVTYFAMNQNFGWHVIFSTQESREASASWYWPSEEAIAVPVSGEQVKRR
jgi:hypothetical protein